MPVIMIDVLGRTISVQKWGMQMKSEPRVDNHLCLSVY
jgi:hypothetical protein